MLEDAAGPHRGPFPDLAFARNAGWHQPVVPVPASGAVVAVVRLAARAPAMHRHQIGVVVRAVASR